MRKFKFSYLLVMQITVIMFFVSSAFAQDLSTYFGGIDPIKIIFGSEVPAEWYDLYKFMQYLIFPFIGIWMIMYGLFEELKIFRHKSGVQALLALVITLIASAGGGVVIMSRGLFAIMGGWAVLVFFGVFMVGASLWGFGTMRSSYASSVKMYNVYNEEEKNLNTKITDLETQYSQAMTSTPPNLAKAQVLHVQILQLKARLDDIRKIYAARP